MGRFFIERPVMAMVIAIIIVLLGVVAMLKLPIALFPDIIPPEIAVTTTYTGADAVTIEQSVATPLEQKLNGVDNMLYLRSTNANDGTLSLKVTFAVGTDIDTDNVLVQNRVSEAMPSLPVDVKNYGVTVKKSLGFPLMLFTVYSPHDTYDAAFLGNYAVINLNDALLRVPGVGQVTMFGSSDYAMRIWVSPDVLQKRGLTISDLQDALRKQSTVNPAGQVGAEPAPSGQEFTYAVRALGRLVTPEEFGEVVVRENPDGSMIRLKDVAHIELGTLTYNQRGRFNGKPAAVIGVYQAPGSNALAVVEGAKKAIEDLRDRFPPDLDAVVSLDTTAAVSEGIREILKTLAEAMALVLLVVYLFLQSFRATLIPMLTVPVSLIGTFAFFPMLGFSLNTLSLLGLVLAIGIVVDDAIVVVEAVEHHIEHGLTPKEATQRAMDEVSGPIFAISLILAAVFVPVAFTPGITGRLYQQFALTIAISVQISAINALSLSPALCSLLLRKRKPSKGLLARFFGGFNNVFGKITEGYVGLTGALARRLVRTGLILAALTAGLMLVGSRLAPGFVPDEDQGYFYVNVLLPDAASLQRTDAVCKEIEKILGEQEGVEYSTTIAGYSLLSGASATYSGFLFVSLKSWHERHDLTAKQIMAQLNAKFSRLPQASIFAFLPPAIPGIGAASGFSFMLQDRAGGSVTDLAEQTRLFMEEARKHPEIGAMTTTYRASVPQVFAKVDRDHMLKMGVDPGDLYAALQANMGGSYINDFNRFGRQWKVYLSADPDYRTRAEDIGRFTVRSKNGSTVLLSSLIDVEDINGPEFTQRFNLFRAAEITGSAAPGYSSGQAMQVLEDLGKQLPRNFGYAWNGLSYQQKTASGGTAALALAVFMVFLILAAQYESWSLPFSVLLGTPVAALGAFLGLYLSRFDNDVFTQIGLILLIGLAAKNSILIVEFAKLEHEKGKSAIEAALTAARLRFRPILMTAFAFILGCLPLLRAKGAGAVSRQSLGTVVVYGMLMASSVGILLVPALYTAISKLSKGKEPPVPEGQTETPQPPHAA
jgi:HAE1 family hydrophobic/amphiphilic exporter-1